ncbi:MAG TPA: hypothetical protein VK524_14010 [Polyangiaceae bacterium]|nr:hypothetical protein [Polyangiaceae bacterium]
MSSPRRLVDMKPEGLERELLECGQGESVSEHSHKRIWAGVAAGVSVALPGVAASGVGLTGASAGAAGNAAAGGAVVGGAATAVSKVGVAALASKIAVGVISAAVIVGGGAYLARSNAPAASLKAAIRVSESRVVAASRSTTTPAGASKTALESFDAPPADSVPTPVAEDARAGAAARVRARRVEADPSKSNSVAQAPSAVPSPPPASPETEALASEIKLIDSARRALRGGDSAEAERALREHEQNFSSGMLAPEAEVLRIELLQKRGNHDAAAAAARNFLTAHPASPHAGRVRAVLAAAIHR